MSGKLILHDLTATKKSSPPMTWASTPPTDTTLGNEAQAKRPMDSFDHYLPLGPPGTPTPNYDAAPSPPSQTKVHKSASAIGVSRSHTFDGLSFHFTLEVIGLPSLLHDVAPASQALVLKLPVVVHPFAARRDCINSIPVLDDFPINDAE